MENILRFVRFITPPIFLIMALYNHIFTEDQIEAIFLMTQACFCLIWYYGELKNAKTTD